MTHADYHPCSEGCGRDSELPGPCEECDMRRRLAARATGPTLPIEALALLERMHALSEDLRVAKADVEWYPLPPDFEVVGGEGELIRPSPGRQFFVTVEPWP